MMGTAMAAASWPRVRPLEEAASAVILDAVFDPELVPVGEGVDDDVDEVEGVTVLLATLLLLVMLPKVPRNPGTLLLVVLPKVTRNGTTDEVVVDVLRMVLTIVVLDVCVPAICVDVVVLKVVKTRPTPPPASAPSVVVATAVRCVDVPGAVKPKNGVPVVNGSPKNGLPAIRRSSSRPREMIGTRRGAAQERCSGLHVQSCQSTHAVTIRRLVKSISMRLSKSSRTAQHAQLSLIPMRQGPGTVLGAAKEY